MEKLVTLYITEETKEAESILLNQYCIGNNLNPYENKL